MKSFLSKAIAYTAFAAVITGCASGLTVNQEREYAAFERNNVLVKEKDPTSGALFGLLPGGGSFYAREPGLGVANLFLWPLSIAWDTTSGYDGAKAINYDATRYELDRKKKKELTVLTDKYAVDDISKKEYLLEKQKIENAYSFAP